jgi:uncharacterized protein YlxW (UPF0749 family)
MSDNSLLSKSQIKAAPLQSNAPVVGSLIAKFRNAWGAVAAKWMIAHVVSQQNEFNQLLASHLETASEQLIEQDRDLVALTRQVAEMNIAMRQLQQQVQELEAQLAQLEADKSL